MLLRALAVLTVVPMPAPAQVARALVVNDLLADPAWPAPAQDQAARSAALTELLDKVLEFEDANRLRLISQKHLVVQGTQEQLQQVQELLLALRQQQSRPLMLQLTVLQMPEALAKKHALSGGKAKAVQVPALTPLLRDLQAAGGRMINLPPTTAGTLQLVRPVLPAARADGKPAVAMPSLELQTLALAGKAAVRVSLSLPAAKPGAQPEPTQLPTVVLAAGDGVLLTCIDGEQATVVWLRLMSIGEPQLRDAGRVGAPAAPAIRPVPRK